MRSLAGDLAGKIKARQHSKEAFTEKQILNWVIQVCIALSYLDDQKLMHRDLKPSNLFLTDAGIIKVGDFGQAKFNDHTA